jgi:predicted nucleic acid-binding Zn finger protein
MMTEVLMKEDNRLVLRVPSNTIPDKTYFLTITKTPERTYCECLGFKTHGYCDHIRKNKTVIEEFLNAERAEDPVDVQYFSKMLGACLQSQHHKAQKFIQHRCIQWDIERETFVCMPIPGYNTQTYTLKKNDGFFSCDCQSYVTKQKQTGQGWCSHILALLIWLKRKENTPQNI